MTGECANLPWWKKPACQANQFRKKAQKNADRAARRAANNYVDRQSGGMKTEIEERIGQKIDVTDPESVADAKKKGKEVAEKAAIAAGKKEENIVKSKELLMKVQSTNEEFAEVLMTQDELVTKADFDKMLGELDKILIKMEGYFEEMEKVYQEAEDSEKGMGKGYLAAVKPNYDKAKSMFDEAQDTYDVRLPMTEFVKRGEHEIIDSKVEYYEKQLEIEEECGLKYASLGAMDASNFSQTLTSEGRRRLVGVCKCPRAEKSFTHGSDVNKWLDLAKKHKVCEEGNADASGVLLIVLGFVFLFLLLAFL